MNRTARIELVMCEPNVYVDEDGVGWVQTTPSQTPHFLRLRAANGVILAHSEVYSTRSNARRAAGAWLDAMWDVTNSPAPVREVSS